MNSDMNYDPLNTVFKSPKLMFNVHEDKDYRYVTCKMPIKRGDLLLLEQCFTDNTHNPSCTVQMLRYNEHLFNNLYPRTHPWDEANLCVKDLPKDMHELIISKIQSNTFTHNNSLCLGYTISQFNHSITPNAKVVQKSVNIPKEGEADFKVVFLCVVAIKDIHIGEEIFIKYNDTVQFSNNVHSSMPYELEEESKGSDDIILTMIKQYIRKERFAIVTTNQYAMYKGLYLSKDMVNYTQRFSDYIQKEYNLPMNEERIEGWLGSVYKHFADIGIDA